MSKAYEYSKNEKGKDGTINPNYYQDKSIFSNRMAMSHIQQMFSTEEVRGFFKITLLKYDIRANDHKHHGKGNIIQDVSKINTYSKLWERYEKTLARFKKGRNEEHDD